MDDRKEAECEWRMGVLEILPLLCFWFRDGIDSHREWFSKCEPAAAASPGVLLEMHIPGAQSYCIGNSGLLG